MSEGNRPQEPMILRWYDGIVPGFVFGGFLGLSTSPILGIAITGIFGLVTAIVKPEAIDRIPAISKPFISVASSFILLGALCGIWMRANDALSPKEPSIPERLGKMGFDSFQVQRILDHEARAAAGGYHNLRNDAAELGFSKEETDVLMGRMTKEITFPLSRTTVVSSSATPLGNSKATSSQTSPNHDPDTRLFAGFGQSSLGSLVDDIQHSTDKVSSQEYKTTVAEIRLIRGFLHDLNEQLKVNPTLSAELIETLKVYQGYFDKIFDEKNGVTLQTRRLKAGAEERKIQELNKEKIPTP